MPELAAVLKGMTVAKFGKVVAYMGSPLGQRVRTNNHVERLNRQLRIDEQVRYRWRTSRGIVRWLVLLLERCRQSRQGAAGPRLYSPGDGEQPKPMPRAGTTAAQGSEPACCTGLAAVG